jgi:hypothetical protein
MFEGIVVGICGRKGAGKSTLASQLHWAKRVSFGQFLKQGLEAMGLPRELFHDPKLKELPHVLLRGRTPRYTMQTLGTQWGREYMGEHFWVDLFTLEVNRSSGELVVCDDVRFHEEAEAIRRFPGHILVYVATPGEVFYKPKRWWEFWKKEPHESERFNPEVEGIPVIVNDGTPEELYEKFKRLPWPQG